MPGVRPSRERILVGTYTAENPFNDGSGKGLHAFLLDTEGPLTPDGPVLALPSTSFVAAHPRRPLAYAISETVPGRVHSLRLDADGGLQLLGSEETGAEPLHVCVHPSGELLAISCGDGTVRLHAIDDGGATSLRATVRHVGSGPDPVRQASPHAHCASFDARGSLLAVADLGTDRVVCYRVDPEEQTLSELATGRATPGAGPRHLAWTDAESLVVVNELTSTLSLYRLDLEEQTLRQILELPTHSSHGSAPSDDSPRRRSAPSEVIVDRSGRFVLVANRGIDSISVFRRRGDELVLWGESSSMGRTPRHIALIDGRLLVANQDSDDLTIFRWDEVSGSLTEPQQAARIASPACVVRGGRTSSAR